MNRPSPLFIAVCIYLLSTLISMATMNIAAGLLFLVLISTHSVSEILTQVKKIVQNTLVRRFMWAHAALFAVCIFSLFVAMYEPWTLWDRSIHVDLLRDGGKAWFVVWPVIVAIALSFLKENERENALKVYLLFSGGLAVLGILQYFIGFPRPQQIPDMPFYHATLFLGHHLSVASIFPFAFFLSLDRAFFGKKMFWGIAFFLGVMLLLTYSRALWIALPVGVLLFSILYLSKRTALLILLTILAAGTFLLQQPKIYSRVTNGASFHSRDYLWSAHFYSFKKNPVFGIGWNKTIDAASMFIKGPMDKQNFVSHAHNNVLEVLAGTGVAGLLAWLTWWYFVLRMTWALKWRWLFCAWLVFHLNGMLQVNFWDSKVFHQVLLWVSFLMVGVHSQSKIQRGYNELR